MWQPSASAARVPSDWATDRVRGRIDDQIRRAARWMGHDPKLGTLALLSSLCHDLLDRIAVQASNGTMLTGAPLRLEPREPERCPIDREIRLGFFPVNGNPLHWGHLTSALLAISELHLDRLVFVIQGVDPRKLEISGRTEHHRHAMARGVLRILQPLASYSGIGRGSSGVGEDHVFHLLRLNPQQRIRAFYLAGADHYRRFDDLGNPDTVQRLESGIAAPLSDRRGLDPRLHHLEAVFLGRSSMPRRVRTSVPVRFLPGLLDASSTAIREGDVTFAPFETLRYIATHPDYAAALGLRALPAGLLGSEAAATLH